MGEDSNDFIFKFQIGTQMNVPERTDIMNQIPFSPTLMRRAAYPQVICSVSMFNS